MSTTLNDRFWMERITQYGSNGLTERQWRIENGIPLVVKLNKLSPKLFGLHSDEPIFSHTNITRYLIVPAVLPDTGKEIIKSPDTGSISKRESTEDYIKRSFPEHVAPDGAGSYFQF